jgi:hypothetical protein
MSEPADQIGLDQRSVGVVVSYGVTLPLPALLWSADNVLSSFSSPVFFLAKSSAEHMRKVMYISKHEH